MKIQALNRWDLSPAEAIALQRELALNLDLTPAIDAAGVRLIAGVDVSSTRFSPVLTAGIVVWDMERGVVVDSAYVQKESGFPYIPGLLSFREIPVLAEAIALITTVPDVVLVDGQGIAHPRRLGIASHLGLLIDQPTIGVAKSRLFGTSADLSDIAGGIVPLMDRNEQIGFLLRSKARSKPLIISPGNRIDLTSTLAIVQRSLRGYRLPEPTRLAHLYVNEMRVGADTLFTANR